MKKLWEKIKDWVLGKALPWLLKAWDIMLPWFAKNWFIILNYVIIFVAYSVIYGSQFTGVEVLLGLWIFFSIAYAAYKWFIKSNKLNPQPEPPKPKETPKPKQSKSKAKK